MSAKKRTRVISLLWISVVLATIVVYLAQDRIACPDGYTIGSAQHVRTGGTKRHIQITCVTPGGASTDGSMALIILSWVGIVLVVSIGGYKAWKKLAPIAEA